MSLPAVLNTFSGAGGAGTIATGSRAAISDTGGTVIAATTTSTEVGYLSGLTSAVQTQIAGKSWELISTTTVSDVASVDYTDLSSDYIAYRLVISYIRPATDNATLLIRTSTDNGSTFASTAGDYNFGIIFATFSTTPNMSAAGNSNADRITIATGMGNDTNEACCSDVLILNPTASQYTQLFCMSLMTKTSGARHFDYCAGVRLSTTAVDAFRVAYTSGNIAGGTLSLHGIKGS